MFRRKLCGSCKRSEHGGRARGDCVCKCHSYFDTKPEDRDEIRKDNPKLDDFIEKSNKEWAKINH